MSAGVEGEASQVRAELTFARLMAGGAPLSRSLLLLLLLSHGWLWAFGWWSGVGGEGALLFGAKINGLVAAGQWWRLVSALFLHGGALHLGLNGYALWMLGPLLERFYGSRRFVVLYLGSGLGAGLGSYLWTPGASVGASGAVFGLLGALMVFGWRARGRLPARVSRAFGVGLAPWVVVNLVIGLLPGLPIDNAAHLGGLGSGLALGAALSSRLERSSGWLSGLVVELCFALGLLSVSASGVLVVREALLCGASAARLGACYGGSLGDALGGR